MKTFGYTARDGGGRLRKGTVRAEDRASAVRGLRAQGCVPLSVAEDRQGPGGPPKGRRALPWALLAAAAALAGLWLLRGPAREVGGPAPAGATAPGRAAARAGARAVGIAPAAVQGAAIAGEVDGGGGAAAGAEPAGPETAGGDIPAAGEAVGEAKAEVRRRAFASGTEQIIGWLVNTRLGDPPPPLPRLAQSEDIGKILESDIAVFDDDSEEAFAAKANVAYAKQVLRSYLAGGGTVETFLGHYQEQLVEASREWRAAQSNAARLLREGEPGEAELYVEEENQRLAEKGIKPIALPALRR